VKALQCCGAAHLMGDEDLDALYSDRANAGLGKGNEEEA
jgi:hypothetical protein